MRHIVLLCIMVLLYATSSLATEKPAKKISKSYDRGLSAVEKPRDGRKRVALVIGNSNYASSPLKNPVNDARAMASLLRKLGFEVEEKSNLGYIALNEAIEGFGNRMKSGGVGLFYFAGHGMQVQGYNYLVPVDAKINSENEVRYKAVDAGLVLAKMESAKSDVNIVVLDACRDNPFGRSFRSSSRGLANMEAPTGTIIAYATAPGKTAADGDGKNGVYTEALIRALETPGLKVEEVFKQVRKLVLKKTANTQVPWESSSLVGDFHFLQPSQMTDLRPEPVIAAPISGVLPQEISADSSTILLDHFDGSTSATVLAYKQVDGQACGPALPALPPAYSYSSSLSGSYQSLTLFAPIGGTAGSATYLKYPGGQLLSQPNGTIEFLVYLTAWGVSLVDQGPFYGSCAGWTFGLGVSETGQLQANAWAAFTMNSGNVTIPLNNWTHVAATWGSAGAKLFINGTLVGSDDNKGMPASGFGGSLLLRLGTHKGISTSIDELRVSSIQRTNFSTPQSSVSSLPYTYTAGTPHAR